MDRRRVRVTELGAKNVSGMLAQRWALISHLGYLDGDSWRQASDRGGATLLDDVEAVVELYGTVLGEPPFGGGDDHRAWLDELDRRGDLVEAELTATADDRWDMDVDAFRAVGGTAQMAIHRLMAELVVLALRAGAPVPPPAREAAAAAVAWRAGENVDVPALVVLEDCGPHGRELVVGGGEPVLTVHTTALAFVRAGFGLDGDTPELRADGPPDQVEAFLTALRGSWHRFDRDTDETDPP